MPELPLTLIARITARIRDPGTRHDFGPGAPLGVVTDAAELSGMFEAATPGSSQPFQLILEQMKQWGQKMPPMHVSKNADGGLSASAQDESALPLAAPATDAAIARLQAMIGRSLPGDLRQLYAIADGGWGPGTGYTNGYGTGFYSVEVVTSTLEDLRRRGPGYTGEALWPERLLPIADTTGPVSYDLNEGAIVAFNDHYYDDDLSIDEAFSSIYPDLAAWLEAWLAGNDNRARSR